MKSEYIDKLGDIVNKYSLPYHGTIKMKPGNVKSITYTDSGEEINKKYGKFKTGHRIRMSQYKNILQKVLLQIAQEKFLWLKKLEILCPRHILLMILMEKKLLEHFTKKYCKKQIKKNVEFKK